VAPVGVSLRVGLPERRLVAKQDIRKGGCVAAEPTDVSHDSALGGSTRTVRRRSDATVGLRMASLALLGALLLSETLNQVTSPETNSPFLLALPLVAGLIVAWAVLGLAQAVARRREGTGGTKEDTWANASTSARPGTETASIGRRLVAGTALFVAAVVDVFGSGVVYGLAEIYGSSGGGVPAGLAVGAVSGFLALAAGAALPRVGWTRWAAVVVATVGLVGSIAASALALALR
jgi:hypothetical protein